MCDANVQQCDSGGLAIRQTSGGGEFGVQITTDSGTISSDGFTVHWNYDAQTEVLSIQCTDSPIFILCSTINSEIHDMVEATLNQHNIAMARMVPA